jgi:hypothetical protein
MNKIEFIALLDKAHKDAGLFKGRFNRTSNDIWQYNRPAIDCFEPSIDLSVDGVVKYISYKGFTDVESVKEYTYKEFSELYHLA